MPATKTQGGEATRAALIEASYRLFVAKGYHGTSMRDIAAEAGITAGSIYNHFSDKEEIFKAVVYEYHPVVRVLPRLGEVEGGTAEEIIRDAARRIAAEIEQQPSFFNLMAIELVELQGAHLPELVTLLFPALQTFLGKVYGAGGKLRPRNPFNFLRAFVGLMVGYGLTHVAMQATPLADQSKGGLDEMLEIFLHGVLES